VRNVIQDLRTSFRAFKKNPIFAAVAILTLALGIGAVTAIFSVVHAVLLRPLPYPSLDPNQVLVLTERDKKHDQMSVSYPNFKDYQELAESFQSMAAYRNSNYNLTGLDEPVRLRVRLTNFNYFDIMGVSPFLGRFYNVEEDRPGVAGVVVLNHSLWKNRFGGDPDILGSTIELNDERYTVIGVLPQDFELIPRERAYIPLEPWADNPGAKDRGNHQGLMLVARMHPGVSLDEARAEMETVCKQLEQQYPETNSGLTTNVDPIIDVQVGDYRTTLLMIMGAVTLVLMIACTNVANLMLARAVSRKKEYALQAALGAPLRRLVGQGLTEGVLLAIIGGILGVFSAFWGLNLLRGFLPSDIPRLHLAQLDWRVLVYGLVVSSITGIIFGAAPALLASRAKPSDPLKEGGRGTSGRGRTGRSLLVGEVALATLLLIGACLLIRSVYELTRVEPGFRSENLLTFSTQLPESRYTRARARVFYQEIREHLAALPGVTSVTVGLSIPMNDYAWGSIFIVGDKPVPPREDLPSSVFNPVDTGFFETLDIPLLRGRTFQGSDTNDSLPVIVVNETLANHFWPNEDPIGKRLKQGWPESEGEFFPWREIVGVVGDTKQVSLDTETRMETYIPFKQLPIFYAKVVLRTEVDPLSLIEPAKASIHALDSELPVYSVETMESIIATTIAPRRFAMLLLGIFAALALVLSAIGLYGVIAYSVARRTQEIGVRMAVGADRGSVFGLVLREGMTLSFIGALTGVAGALALSHLLAGLLYGVGSKDPLTFTLIPLLLLAVSFAACSVPAFSATRIDPIDALRYE
jgi:putative ABC transport system permease protein